MDKLINPNLPPDVITPVILCVSGVSKYLLIGGCIGTIALPLMLVIIPPLIGFTVGGVVSGSLAALLMSCHAGYIPVNGFVAFMQSIGTMGLALGCNPYAAIIGCLSGLILGGYKAIAMDGVCNIKWDIPH